MSIVAADLVAYAAASMPEDDSSTSGGAIDALRRIDFTQLAANAALEALSSNAGDTTQTITVTGRNAAGSIVSETKTLTGTSVISLSTLGTIERVLKAELSATCVGIVTLRVASAGATVRAIPAGERGFMAIFRKTASDPSSGVDNYCKFFWLNNHGTLSLLAAAITESADPDARITHALDASVNAATSVANRISSPGFTFDGASKAVPGTDLAAAAKIGVWLKLSLTAADTAHRATYTSQLAGQTT